MAINKSTTISFFVFFISGFLFAQENRYMVFYKDKTGTPYSISQPQQFLSTKSMDRRNGQGIAVTAQDLPVNPAYINDVKSTGAVVKYSSRWFNASLVEATSLQKNSIETLSNVLSVEYVAPGKTGDGGRIRAHSKFDAAAASEASQNQNSILGLDEMHRDGLTGSGVTIAVFDTGFPGVNTNPAFADLFENSLLRDSYNFSYGQPNVYIGHEHGTRVLSIIAANLSPTFYGGAFDADFLLYATEFAPNEFRVEEYNWLFAAERADSAGADIISSSLGYNEFDDASMNYTIDDLDGETAVITRAANLAFLRGMVVVNAAGNFGNETWRFIGPPADGENVIAVGSIDKNYLRSNFSSFGPTTDGRIKPDVMAIGTSAASVTPAGTVAFGNGTSYACPMITSLIAGTWQNWPDLTAVEMVALIRQAGSKYFNPDNSFGYGIPTYQAIKNIFEFPVNGITGIWVYPNPTAGELRIAVEPGSGNVVVVQVYSVLGQVMQQASYESIWNLNPFILDLATYTPGIYFVKVSTTNQIKTWRIIKK